MCTIAALAVTLAASPSAGAVAGLAGQDCDPEASSCVVWECTAPNHINCDVAGVFAFGGCAQVAPFISGCVEKTGGVGGHFSSISISQKGGKTLFTAIEAANDRVVTSCSWSVATVGAGGGCLQFETLPDACGPLSATTEGTLQGPNSVGVPAPTAEATIKGPSCDLSDLTGQCLEGGSIHGTVCTPSSPANHGPAWDAEEIEERLEESLKANASRATHRWRQAVTGEEPSPAVVDRFFQRLENRLRAEMETIEVTQGGRISEANHGVDTAETFEVSASPASRSRLDGSSVGLPSLASPNADEQSTTLWIQGPSPRRTPT